MFAEWFRKKYEEWRAGKYGREAGQAAFAREIGINQKSVNEYLNGKSEPAYEEVIDKLYTRFGPEVLIALGREPSLRDEIIHLIDQFPEHTYQKLIKELTSLWNEYEMIELAGEVRNSDLEDE